MESTAPSIGLHQNNKELITVLHGLQYPRFNFMPFPFFHTARANQPAKHAFKKLN